MSEQGMDLKEVIQGILQQNPYVGYMGMELESLSRGKAAIKMMVNSTKHTNLYNTAHGGSMASLADVAMSVACLTHKKKVMTMDMHITWLKAADAERMIYAHAKVILDGAKNMAAEVDIVDEDNEVLAKAQATFVVISKMKFD